MSDRRPPDPDFPDWTPSATPTGSEAAFDRLAGALDTYRSIRSEVRAAQGDPCPQRLADLRQAERAVHACLRTLRWRPATEDAATPAVRPCLTGSRDRAVGAAGTDPDWQPARAALVLVDELAAADRDSRELVERIESGGDPDWRTLLHAARRCRDLVADALLIGAVDLAVRLGIPDGQLPV